MENEVVAVEPKKTLVQKLAEACDEVGGIEKKGKNSTQGYNYVKAADVAKEIRHKLFSRGIVIIPSEEELIQERIETMKGGFMTEVRLKIKYTITDGTDSLAFDAFGVARDSGDKAVYKAKTGAGKYFLRALGLIPDEKDDPEADVSVDDPENAPKFAQQQRKPIQHQGTSKPINAVQAKAFWEHAKSSGKTQREVMDYFGSIGIESTVEMLSRDYDAACAWAKTEGAA